jgi:hypothetical protein
MIKFVLKKKLLHATSKLSILIKPFNSSFIISAQGKALKYYNQETLGGKLHCQSPKLTNRS